MIQASDIGARSQEIRDLVAAFQLASAIKRSMDFVRDFSDRRDLDEITILSMDFRQVEDGMRRGELTFKTGSSERKRLAQQLLKLLRAIEEALSLEIQSA